MPGGFSPHSGSLIPPNKLWMSFVADKYTMMLRTTDQGAHIGYLPASDVAIQPIACTLANKFNIYNASFGAFMTAPDGTTNTCQKIVEDSSTGQHYIQCATRRNNDLIIPPVFRVAGIWNAGGGGRTRVCYQWTGGGFSAITDTAIIGFDLAGGQVAYSQYTGAGASIWSNTNPTITPLGGGFYLCYADISVINGLSQQHFGPNYIFNFRFLLDNGSGTAAPSLSYAGNGTSGLFGWKHSVLPRAAWQISGYTLNEDFNDPTMANIDLNNTQAPGYTWYVQSGNSVWQGNNIVAPGNLTVSGSQLHIPALPSVGINAGGGITSFSMPGGAGRGFRPPWMLETSWLYDYPNVFNPAGGIQSGDPGIWLATTEMSVRMQTAATVPGGNGDPNYWEVDPMESGSYGTAIGTLKSDPRPGHLPSYDLNFLSNPYGARPGGYAFYGYPAFSANYAASNELGYPPNTSVDFSGTFYLQSAGGGAIGTPPGGTWLAWTYAALPASSPSPESPQFLTDFTQLYPRTQIMLPYDRVTGDPGCLLHFANGSYNTLTPMWTATAGLQGNPISFPCSCDQHHFFIMGNFSQAGPGIPWSIDYIRVAQ